MQKDIERYRGMPAIYNAKRHREEREKTRERLRDFLNGKTSPPKNIFEVLMPTDRTERRK